MLDSPDVLPECEVAWPHDMLPWSKTTQAQRFVDNLIAGMLRLLSIALHT